MLLIYYSKLWSRTPNNKKLIKKGIVMHSESETLVISNKWMNDFCYHWSKTQRNGYAKQEKIKK